MVARKYFKIIVFLFSFETLFAFRLNGKYGDDSRNSVIFLLFILSAITISHTHTRASLPFSAACGRLLMPARRISTEPMVLFMFNRYRVACLVAATLFSHEGNESERQRYI